MRLTQRRIKRALDICAAGGGLLITAPLLLAIAAAIRFTMGSPVIFRQRRPGLHHEPFTMVKFRTMRHALDADGVPLPDAQRVTRLGRLLRSTSLDELPELWNVLRGEMSLVGPRPLLIDYLPRYTVEQRRRHAVRPGITGLAQISGRQGITFSKRLDLDVWYVDNWSIWLDLRIVAKTLPSVLASRGVIVGQEVSDVDDLGLSHGASGGSSMAEGARL